jgi:hypothetical protein
VIGDAATVSPGAASSLRPVHDLRDAAARRVWGHARRQDRDTP